MTELKTEPLAAPPETDAEAPEASQTAQSPNPAARYNPVSPATKKKSFGQILLYVAGAAFALLVLDFLVQIPRWMKEAHVRRVQRIVDTVTPGSVISRCGQPLEDVTNDLYPMISRRMTYNSPIAGQSRPGKVVLFFSRTSEENSDWIYSSMRDESGATSYNTPDEQMAALPCLAVTK